MKKTFLGFALLFCTLAVQAQEWVPIFNGEDLEGWEHVGDGRFVVEDGLLRTEGGMGLLWYTPLKFENAQIKVVYRGAETNNSGVYIRIPEKPTEPWMPVHKGYEVQIDDSLDEYHATGTLYSISRAMSAPGKPNEWNEMIITLRGDRTIVDVNGVTVTDFTEGDPVPERVKDYEPERGPRPVSGFIGLQNHAEEDTVYFKEVSYRLMDERGVKRRRPGRNP
jgi:hypothetical protein